MTGTKMMTNTEMIKGEWKIMEYWRGSFYFFDNKISSNWKETREAIVSYCKEGAENFLEQLKINQIISREKVQVIEPEDDDGKKIIDYYDLPLKYIQFPLFWLDLGRFKCKVGIRINICSKPNLSKIFVYFITVNKENYFTNIDLQDFKGLAKQNAEKLNNDVFKIYQDAIYKKIQLKIKSTPYYLELYNLGSTSNLVKEFVSNDNIEQMKELLKYPEVKHAYYTMISLAGTNFNTNKNIDQLKKELQEQPKQALIPSHYPCETFYVQSLYAQPEAENDYKPLLLAGITAIDLDSISNINWEKVGADQTHRQSPFCRIKSDFTPIEAWHHSTSNKLIITFASL